ncbi:MAG: hypothetical protein K8S15_11710 [Candidatus Aegiribacteria sp.]|nr:hypothetical protein [Candidatus Aegiribacteria sp.]
MKITIRSMICPVLRGIVLAGLLLLSNCGTANEEVEAVPSVEREPSVAHTVEVTGFGFEVSPPDTVSVKWSGEGSAVVTDVYASSGQEIHTGDTLFQLREDLHIVERERLAMQFDLASAMLSSAPSDTLLRERVDSLDLLMDSLLSCEKTSYLSPLEGTLERIHIAVDQRIRPGDMFAEISVASSELFHVFPPSDCTMNFWPSGSGGIRFVEERSGYAVYSGELSVIEAGFSELVAVPREAVYESDLESYLITVDYDTISVIRTGMKNNSLVVLLPEEPVLVDLLTWAGK